jgi:hypothetical protein
MSDDWEEEARDIAPGPEVTAELYTKWRDARRGTVPAERLTNPVWDWLIRSRIWPYGAATHFGLQATFPTSPRWCFSRYGMSKTELPDGRKLFVAGEHEDHYDPDFYIYNDVIVWNPDDTIEVYGYPVSVFSPTDSHSATLVGDDLFLLGNLGYPDDRRPGQTAAFKLNTRSLRIAPLRTHGEGPGWIHKHRAELTPEGILIRGGNVMTRQTMLENIDDWLLEIGSLTWRRLTDRQWPRIEFRRHDGSMNKLWEIRSVNQYQAFGETFQDSFEKGLASLAREGIVPDPALLADLYHPPLEHQTSQQIGKDHFNEHRIQIGEIAVRYEEDMDSIVATVEGKLSAAELQLLATDLQSKLARLEGRPYVFRMW